MLIPTGGETDSKDHWGEKASLSKNRLKVPLGIFSISS